MQDAWVFGRSPLLHLLVPRPFMGIIAGAKQRALAAGSLVAEGQPDTVCRRTRAQYSLKHVSLDELEQTLDQLPPEPIVTLVDDDTLAYRDFLEVSCAGYQLRLNLTRHRDMVTC